jgi:hypothetical protein
MTSVSLHKHEEKVIQTINQLRFCYCQDAIKRFVAKQRIITMNKGKLGDMLAINMNDMAPHASSLHLTDPTQYYIKALVQ